MISKLLQTKSSINNSQNGLSDLFSRPIKAITFEPEPEEVAEPVIEEPIEEENEELTNLQIQERNERTIFVGNIEIDLDKKHLLKHFKQSGKIEKIWFRSIPIEDGKLPVKASVILKKFNKEASGKNAYILFSNKEEAASALQLNGTVIKSNHIRVDSAIPKALDTTMTIFIGNLPFTATEEELRKFFFSQCGAIENIRIIRDPKTHVGKGIAYVTFQNIAAFKAGLKLNGANFKERGLRIKKAAPLARVEKKIQKKKSIVQNNAERRIEMRRRQMEAAGGSQAATTYTAPNKHEFLGEDTQAHKSDSNILNKKIRKIGRDAEERTSSFKGSKGNSAVKKNFNKDNLRENNKPVKRHGPRVQGADQRVFKSKD